MLRRLAIGVLWALPGYILGGVGGGYLVYLASTNRHDRSVEAAMTGAFVLGPAAALTGFAIGVWRAGKRRSDSDSGG